MSICRFIRRHVRLPIPVLIVILLIAAIVTWLAADLVINFSKAGPALNVAKGQLIAEVLGSGVLVIAIMEFMEVSRRPDLLLWAQAFDGRFTRVDMSEIHGTWQSTPFQTHPGIVNQPITDLMLHKMHFSIQLENYGRRMARFVKATIALGEIGEPPS